MDQTFTCILLLLSLSATLGKYVYIKERKNWHDAQKYCRRIHTDLAPVSSRHDMRQLQRLAGGFIFYSWMGMKRNATDREKWTWSGGGEVSTFFWAWDQPQNSQNEDYGLIFGDSWHDARPGHVTTFFCYSAVVVRERKTWEEALDYCREHHGDLASVASDTEMMLIKKELDKNETTEHVWIGLHFFPGHWHWVDGQPVSYEAWGQGGKPACPLVKMECAALKVMVGTQGSNSTNSTLVTSTTMGPEVVHIDNTGGSGLKTVAHAGLESSGETDAAAAIKESVWEPHDCEERLHFICY